MVVCFSVWPGDKFASCAGCNPPSSQDGWVRISHPPHLTLSAGGSSDGWWLDDWWMDLNFTCSKLHLISSGCTSEQSSRTILPACRHFSLFSLFNNGALVIFWIFIKGTQVVPHWWLSGRQTSNEHLTSEKSNRHNFSSARPNEIRDATTMSSCFIISALLGSGLLLRSSQPLSCTKPLQSLSSSFILRAFHHSHVVSLQSAWLLFFFFLEHPCQYSQQSAHVFPSDFLTNDWCSRLH